jgi:hypothetical protein
MKRKNKLIYWLEFRGIYNCALAGIVCLGIGIHRKYAFIHNINFAIKANPDL